MGNVGISFKSAFHAKAFIARELKKNENHFIDSILACEQNHQGEVNESLLQVDDRPKRTVRIVP